MFNNESLNDDGKVFIVRSEDGQNEEDNYGKIVFVRGPYTGKVIKLVPEQEIIIGRDGDVCDIVINLPKISRQHLYITYHMETNVYEVMDVSTNGTYMYDDIRLEKNVRYEINAGENIQLGDGNTELKLY